MEKSIGGVVWRDRFTSMGSAFICAICGICGSAFDLEKIMRSLADTQEGGFYFVVFLSSWWIFLGSRVDVVEVVPLQGLEARLSDEAHQLRLL